MLWIIKQAIKILGNIYWKIFGGVIMWGLWVAIGIVFALTIVGFPIAIKFFKISYVAWKPFGKYVVVIGQNYFLSFLWFISFGLIMSGFCIFNIIISFFSIVGIPLIKQWFKITKISLFPMCVLINF